MSHYVTENRALIQAIKVAHQKFGMSYKLFSHDWIVKLEKNNSTHFIYGYAFGVNSQASAAIAADKVATSELLSDNSVTCVPHYLVTSVLDQNVNATALQTLIDTYTSLVLKPTFGGRGHLVRKVNSAEQALEYIDKNPVRSWSASPFIAAQREMRIVVFNSTIRLAYEKYDPKVVDGLNMFNLSGGASVRQVDLTTLDADIGELALRAAATIGLKMGAVDIIFDESNKAHVLEINSGFSLEHFALDSSENRKNVVDCYVQILDEMFED